MNASKKTIILLLLLICLKTIGAAIVKSFNLIVDDTTLGMSTALTLNDIEYEGSFTGQEFELSTNFDMNYAFGSIESETNVKALA